MADLLQKDLQLSRPDMPDNTGVSRGIDATNMFDKLFSGIGDAIQVATKTHDSDIQDNIRKDARAGYDQLLGESGVGANTDTPQGVTDGVEQLKLMQNAYEQGRITDTHFYGRMTAQLKSLRAKYPGYEDIVDNAVQDITGVRPANAYRNALMDMINQEEQSAQNESNKWDTYVKQNEEYIYNVAPDYFENPDKYDKNQLRSDVAKWKAQDQGFQSENLRISNLKARDELTQETAEETVTSQFSQLVSMNLETLNKTMSLDKVSAGMLNGVSPSTEEYGQLVSGFQQQKLAMRQKLLAEAAKPFGNDTNDNWYSVAGGAEKVNKIIDEVMAPYDQIEAYLGAKDFNMATYHSKLNEYRGDRDLSTILNSNDALRAGSAISKISPALADTFFNQNEAARSAVQNLTPEILSGIVLGNDTVGGAASRIVNSRQTVANKGTAVKDLIDGTLRGITSGTGSPKEQKDLIKNAYDPSSTDSLFKLVKPEEYQKLYAKMYNPEVTKAIAATGDSEAMKLYTTSAMDRLGAIPEIRRMAADFQEGVEYAKYIKVNYDEKTNRLVVTMDPPVQAKNGVGSIAAWRNNKAVARMIEGKDALNTAFATLGPIIEAAGGDETTGIQQVMQNLAIDLHADKKDSIIWQLYQKTVDAKAEASRQQGKDFIQKTKDDFNAVVDDYTKHRAEELGKTTTDPVEGLTGGFLKPTDAPEQAPIPKADDGAVRARPASLIMGMGSVKNMAAGAGENPRPKGGGLADLVTSNKRGYTPDVEHLRPAMKQGLIDLQSTWGEPIPIISGYRGKARNAKAGGAKKSQHIHGNAVDIDVSSWSIKKRQRFIKAARAADFGGIGIYANSIHIDKGKRRAWGPSHHSNSIPKWALGYL